ncbi:LysR family transcriptional regulator, cys regulon transcriptional activator [Roseateles sp. YR242]|uniref:CysB family HTH-type transcriptional regulator n=1 Tax=Roseateles sp. YR242 TaxID=1855305 RepID=UPI0008BC8E14|nr:CysB family HTH-type transcriptional regulator [Roseateles sp. YR242]SEK86483.1 LysR family transcriptional regulator, cys regulon transcriptional activator [Roseateles sp. YR242]
MNFQQLRSVREAQRRGFNLTEVAQALHTSQPGVSRQIRELEDELGIDIFIRAGKRLTGLTEPGRNVMPIVERLLREAENLRRAGEDFARADSGHLRIAATHSQARYALPPAVRDFRNTHPEVSLQFQQGTPQQVARLLMDGEADIGIATEALTQHPELLTLPCYRWTHTVLVPPDHPLALESANGQPLTLEQIGRYPIITYESGYTGRGHIDEAFARAGVNLNVVLVAMDADVIKTYVELGLGVGIVAAIAYDEERDRLLRAIDARHLFADNLTRLAVRRDAYLRDYVYAFIETFAPPLHRDVVEQARLTPSLAD